MPKKKIVKKNIQEQKKPVVVVAPPVREQPRIQMQRRDFVLFICAIFFLGFILGSSIIQPQIMEQQKNQQTMTLSNEKTVEMLLPAVDTTGKGVVGKLQTTIRSGNGRILVNVNNVLSNIDTQLSGRIAAEAASNATNISLANMDVIYNLEANATIIEGPSAGAAMAVSVLLALENKQPNPTVFITGTINEDGTIGQIGNIEAKAEAAKANGGTLLLIPEGQMQNSRSERTRSCRMENGRQLCRVVYQHVENATMLGIDVRAVHSIQDAADYFLAA